MINFETGGDEFSRIKIYFILLRAEQIGDVFILIKDSGYNLKKWPGKRVKY